MKFNLIDLLKEVVEYQNIDNVESGIGNLNVSLGYDIKLDIGNGIIINDDNVRILGSGLNEYKVNTLLLLPKQLGNIVVTYWVVDNIYYITHFGELGSVQLFTNKDSTNESDIVIKYNETLGILKDFEQMYKDRFDAFNSWSPSPNDGGTALKALLTTYVNKNKPDVSNTFDKDNNIFQGR